MGQIGRIALQDSLAPINLQLDDPRIVFFIPKRTPLDAVELAIEIHRIKPPQSSIDEPVVVGEIEKSKAGFAEDGVDLLEILDIGFADHRVRLLQDRARAAKGLNLGALNVELADTAA